MLVLPEVFANDLVAQRRRSCQMLVTTHAVQLWQPDPQDSGLFLSVHCDMKRFDSLFRKYIACPHLVLRIVMDISFLGAQAAAFADVWLE